jgi:peptide/nickel transport system substrate-binding protein
VGDWANELNIGIVESPSLWAAWLSLNLVRQPFIQKEVRQAVSLAINPDAMLETIMLGQGQSGRRGWPHPDARWTKSGLEQPYDPEKSKSLWETLGFVDKDGDGYREQPDGTELDWKIIVQSNQPLFVRAAEMVVEQLAEVGLKSHVQVLDPAGFTGTAYRTMDFDMSVGEIVPHGLADEDMLIILRNVDRARELIKDEEKDAIVARWFEATTSEERMVFAGELQELNNRYPNYIILWYPKGLWAYRRDAYDNYAVSPGYGIFHKWSFLPDEARKHTTMK